MSSVFVIPGVYNTQLYVLEAMFSKNLGPPRSREPAHERLQGDWLVDKSPRYCSLPMHWEKGGLSNSEPSRSYGSGAFDTRLFGFLQTRGEEAANGYSHPI